eukprot:g9556.t1
MFEKVPAFEWEGMAKNSGLGHPIWKKGREACAKALSLAVVVEDMDFPSGVGESTNRVFNHFWAVNIPGDWKSFSAANVDTIYRNQKLVFVGKNDSGKRDLALICPKKGTHRYRFTVWALRDYLSSGDSPMDVDVSYGEVLPRLEELELAKVVIYANVKADPTTR